MTHKDNEDNVTFLLERITTQPTHIYPYNTESKNQDIYSLWLLYNEIDCNLMIQVFSLL